MPIYTVYAECMYNMLYVHIHIFAMLDMHNTNHIDYNLHFSFVLCHIANLLAESFGDRAVVTPEEYSSECSVEGPIDCTLLSETLCVSVSSCEDKVKLSPEDLEVWEL